EDGILDDLVTGVQTCALPISWFPKCHTLGFDEISAAIVDMVNVYIRGFAGEKLVAGLAAPFQVSVVVDHKDATTNHRVAGDETRSEERRVGKGWRCVVAGTEE